ncbi:MAG TPA: hypothetical protein VK601_07705 [Kofleriaceae bacterium]|nr:hypothetical protein [Kofleriaceae bacterium]
MSRTTYERLKAFCETNNISMSQLVETRVNDFLGPNDAPSAPSPSASAVSPASFATSFGASASASPGAPRPMAPRPAPPIAAARPIESAARAGLSTPPGTPGAPSAPAPAASAPAPMTSAAARFAVDPPPPIIKPRQDTAAPKPAEKRPEQIFTF